jgi:hypothetical protein
MTACTTVVFQMGRGILYSIIAIILLVPIILLSVYNYSIGEHKKEAEDLSFRISLTHSYYKSLENLLKKDVEFDYKEDGISTKTMDSISGNFQETDATADLWNKTGIEASFSVESLNFTDEEIFLSFNEQKSSFSLSHMDVNFTTDPSTIESDCSGDGNKITINEDERVFSQEFCQITSNSTEATQTVFTITPTSIQIDTDEEGTLFFSFRPEQLGIELEVSSKDIRKKGEVEIWK